MPANKTRRDLFATVEARIKEPRYFLIGVDRFLISGLVSSM